MQYRRFGRTGWQISEVGYGMWGLADWTGSDDAETMTSLHRSVELGCNFFDTAFAYGDGHSETLLGQLVRAHPDQRLYTASKVPPKNGIWPSRRTFTLADVFPADYIRQMTYTTLDNLGLPSLDLMQFHVWEDAWAYDERWQRAVSDLRDEGVVKAWGISVNRWEPWNVLNTLRSGLIDAVQVIYNIFDQAPEDQLYPVARELDVAIIARVPFDEGSLTGMLTKETVFPADDWRSTYFVPHNLAESVERADALRPLIPAGMTMADMALRWTLCDPTVSTVIPGMRKLRNVEANIAVSDGAGLPADLLAALRQHRWDRWPTDWSQ